MAGNSRGRESSLRRWRALRVATPAFRLGEAREPFTTARSICRTGNRRDLGRCKTREGLAARALPLSYRHCCLAGVEPATPSLKAKYQASSPPFGKGVVGERSKRKRHPETQGRPREGKARSPRRDVHCGGRLHGTDRMPVSPPGGAAVARSIRIFTTDKSFQGNRRRGLLRFGDEGIRVFTTWSQNSPLFPIQWLRRGGKQKTPPERGLGRGSINSNCGVALGHSALARARARVTLCKARGVPFQIVEHAVHVGALGCRWTTIARRRVRCMIVDRGGVKAVCGRISDAQPGRVLPTANQIATPASASANTRRTIASRLGSASARSNDPANATMRRCASVAMIR
jgi:hypothetical protein